MAPQVYIAYADDMLPLATAICDEIEQRGITCWLRDRDAAPDEALNETVPRMIGLARTFIIIASAGIDQSPLIETETTAASGATGFLIVVDLPDIQLPESLSSRLAGAFRIVLGDKPAALWPRAVAEDVALLVDPEHDDPIIPDDELFELSAPEDGDDSISLDDDDSDVNFLLEDDESLDLVDPEDDDPITPDDELFELSAPEDDGDSISLDDEDSDMSFLLDDDGALDLVDPEDDEAITLDDEDSDTDFVLADEGEECDEPIAGAMSEEAFRDTAFSMDLSDGDESAALEASMDDEPPMPDAVMADDEFMLRAAPEPIEVTLLPPDKVKIVISTPEGDRRFSARVPTDAQAGQLANQLAETFKLPGTGPDGARVDYQLRDCATDTILPETMTLASAVIGEGDEVQLVAGQAAGDAPGSVDMVDLRLSAFHPREVVAEKVQRLVAYAHIESAKPEVTRHALEALELSAEEVRAVSETARRAVSREAEVLVVPQAEGLTFSPSQQFLSLWEDWQAAEFRFRAAADRTGGACSGSVMFLVEGMLIAEVPISVFVRAAGADATFGEEMAQVAASPYRRIFPSHSHQDIEIITACERYTAMCGDEYLRDVRALRSGEEWSPRLLELIDEADVFQLFWSPNAAQSPYVEEEWRHALTQQAGSFIRPIYWQQPLSDPPIELGHIHFAFIELEPGSD